MRRLLFLLAVVVACGGDSGPIEPKTTELPLMSVDGVGLPASVGQVSVASGRVRGTPQVSTCNWVIRTSTGAEASGGSFDCPIERGIAVALTLTLGGIFGPGAHVYRFGP